MATLEGADGWEEADAASYDSVDAGMNGAEPETPGLGFSAAEIVDAARVQDEVAYLAQAAVSRKAAMRSFGKDPRDLDPRDML